jgi:hypothetical protein
MRQINLFTTSGSLPLEVELELDAGGLLAWQQRVLQFQQQQRQQHSHGQTNLFSAACPAAPPEVPEPLSLPPQHLQFWRWPTPPNQGAALYFVFDHSLGQGQELLLYLGETMQADRRWKGSHDCKDYLAAYGETLVRCQQRPQFSIRFWCDAPSDTRQRRRLEQQQIRHWLPPFNKECRQRWQTPFQNQQR